MRERSAQRHHVAVGRLRPILAAVKGLGLDPMAVLDSRLRVRGIDALRVVDAGAMPTITSGNTNSPVLMIAERAAEWIRTEHAAP